MTLRGQKFQINLDDEDEESHVPATAPSLFSFVNDIKERSPSAPTASAPAPPALRSNRDGFPTSKKRLGTSRFKQARAANTQATQDEVSPVLSSPLPARDQAAPKHDEPESFMATERRRIDEENRQKLADMSPEEIEEERRELMRNLDSSLIERLLRRANIDEGEAQGGDFPGLSQEQTSSKPRASKPQKSVRFAAPGSESTLDAPTSNEGAQVVGQTESQPEDEADSTSDHEEHGHAELENPLPAEAGVHFPRPPQPPALDSSSESFLTDLHEKYFPDLPNDPSKLEWMTSSASDDTYSPSQSGLDPKDIRFSFTGTLIPPKLAAEIPVTFGLHHHGDAPNAAGYTIPELTMLARSTVPAQRCVAFQTLGRMLFRLGKGEFGDAGDGGDNTVGAEDTLGELARGLWSEVEKNGVIELCISESEGQGIAGGKHVSARAYATEAVWLWRKGGGRRMKAG